MQRRKFIKISTATTIAMPLIGLSQSTKSKPDWLIEWIKQNDAVIPNFKNIRISDPNSPHFGGFIDADEIPNVHSTSSFVQRASWAVSTAESAYFQSKELLKEIELGLKYLLKSQHADGTIDLLSTNFHSTPDTGFIVMYLAPAYKLLSQAKLTDNEGVMGLFKTFLLRSGEALSIGGIHTPNHRWVVCAALAKLHELFPNPAYLNRAEQWLAEHIDIDEDGQYNEKSTLIYSPLTNRVLLMIAIGFSKPELIDIVHKNLKMTMFYAHPNGEIATEASGRQDKALVGMMEGYYYPYRYLALKKNDGEMAAMCRFIEQTAGNKIGGYLDFFLEDSTLLEDLPVSKSLPTNFDKFFKNSGLVRLRREQIDTTILINNPVFMTFQKGDAVLQGIRLAASFFGKGQFQSEKIEQVGNTWVLKQYLEGPYFQPIQKEQISLDGDWEKMPRSNRKQSEIQKYECTTKIKMDEQGKVELTIEMTGTEGVPMALELIFRKGGTLTGVQKHSTKENVYFFTEQNGTYTFKNDKIEFSGSKSLHKNTQLRGALPAMDAPTVYLTGFTPFKYVLRIS
jgi:hypothetical protein